ncbi:hypothetical protein Bbelb_073810 [Branchiostoma belcheri]|nr:hypothetical protein Bbelb_073810 [Branchiostoma belcheri]
MELMVSSDTAIHGTDGEFSTKEKSTLMGEGGISPTSGMYYNTCCGRRYPRKPTERWEEVKRAFHNLYTRTNANHRFIPPMRSNAMFTRVAMDTGSNSTHSTSFVLTNKVKNTEKNPREVANLSVLLRASALRITEENPYDTMSALMMAENNLSQVETGGGDLRKLTHESDEGRLKPEQEGDAASSFSESANVSKLVQGYDHEAQVASQSHGVSSGIPTHGLPDADRVLISLRPSVLKNKDKAELEQLTEQPTSTPSAASVVTGTSPPKPPRLHHGGDTGETTDPVPLPETARREGFVLYRDRLGEWFRFLADDDHILDELFGDGEELHRLYCRTGALERQATLPVGRLLAIDGLSVRGMTDSELLDVLNTSDSVDPVISIDPLDFEMTTQTTLQSLISEPVPTDEEESSDEESSDEESSDEESSDEESSDEESSDEDTSDDEESSEVEESSEDEESCEDEEETQENGDTQQQVRPVRKRGRLATFFSRCRRALTSCWRR